MAVLSQAVAATYNEVIKDRNKPHNQWAENAFLNALETKGFMDRSKGGNQIEISLDIQINAGAAILTSDTTATSTSETDVLGGAVYDWKPVVAPIVWTIAQDARSFSSELEKVNFLRSLTENGLKSSDFKIEAALFSTSTNGFLGMQNLIPTTGQPNVGGIDGASAAYWRNYADTYQADGSDIVLAAELAYDTAAKGTGGSQPTLVVSGIDGYALFTSQLQPLQRYSNMDTAMAGFKALKVKSADFVFSNAGATNIYFLNPRGFSLVVNKAFWRKLLETERMTAAATYQKLIFSHAQAVVMAPSRLAVLSQA